MRRLPPLWFLLSVIAACGGAAQTSPPTQDAATTADVPPQPPAPATDAPVTGPPEVTDVPVAPIDVAPAVPEVAGEDGGPDLAPARPCPGLFCESFEDVAAGSPPDPAIWTRTSDDLVVDVTDGALGSKKALHVPSVVNGFKYIREKKSIAAMGTKFYGRVWFRIDRRPLERPVDLFHWTLLSADEVDDYLKGKLIRFGGHIEGDNTNWLRFNFQTHNMPGETGLNDMAYKLDTKKWYCVEFYYSLPDQEARIWMNGVERPALHWLRSVPGYTFPASISQMSFGWAEAHGIATPWEVWVDEIVLDTKKIGCGN